VPNPESIDHFSIERSGQGNNWTAIEDKAAISNSMTYHSTDRSPLTGYNLYRIKIIKKTNAVVYSPIEKVYVPEKSSSITIYPNPAHNKVTLTGASTGSLFILSDVSGKLTWQKRIITSQGVAEIDLPSLASGVYIAKIDGIIKQLVIR